VNMPPWLALLGTGMLGWLKGDLMLTRHEVAGLTGGLLHTGAPPQGQTAFSAWAAAQGALLGRGYRSELAAHYHAGPLA